jgi:hypothetical protein
MQPTMMELKVMTMLHMDIHQNEHRNRLNWGVPNMDKILSFCRRIIVGIIFDISLVMRSKVCKMEETQCHNCLTLCVVMGILIFSP